MKRFLPFPKPKHSLNPLFFLLLLAALILFAFGAMAQAPAVTYRGTLGLPMNAPMIPVSPQNTGGAVSVTYPASPVAVGTFPHNLIGAAKDKSGNIYAIAQTNNVLYELSNGTVTSVAGAPSQMNAIASDTSGNIYVAARSHIYKWVGGNLVLMGTASNTIESLAVDPAGNFYVAEADEVLYKILSGGTTQTVVTGVDSPNQVCIDRSGNIFYAGDSGQIDEIPAILGYEVPLFQYGQPANDITTDLAGNLYIIPANVDANATRYNPNTNTAVLVGPTIAGNLSYIVVDASYDMYFPSDAPGFSRQIIAEAPASDGYTVSPALPFGINLDRITGIISGTPIVAAPAINYTITAANSSGSSTSVINLQAGFVSTAYYGTAPQAYNQNTPISPWVPQASGTPLTGAAYSAPSVVAVGFSTPADVTADASGNVYVADEANNYISEIVPGGGNPGGTGSGFSSPAGVVADAAGNIYVADSGNGAIKEVLHSNGSVQTIVSGLTAPQAIARDIAGNLFVINRTTVYKIAAGQNTATTLVSGLPDLSGIAVDVGDNLYITSGSAGRVYKITAGNTTAADMGIYLSLPNGIAVDNAGNLWITAAGTHSLYEVAAGGSTATLVSNSFTVPAGVSAGSDGSIYITDSSAGNVFELVPNGGFYLNQQLPLGLAMDPATGTISGTPQMQSAVTNYNVTIYAGLVAYSAQFSLSVGAPLLPPAISYQNPPAYALGVAITPLSPANTGNLAPVTYNGTPQAISFAYANTQQLGKGVALDSKGNIYVADFANGKQILEYTNGQVIQLADGYNFPAGIVVDKAGNVYFTDRTVVYKMVPGGTPVVIANFTEANSMAIGTDGSLYVADRGDGGSNPGGIFKMNNDGSNMTNVATGVQYPSLVAVDSLGDVFAYSNSANTLYKIAAGSSQQSIFSTSLQNPTCLASDKNGNIYFGADVPIPSSAGFENNIYFISPAGGTPHLLVTVGPDYETTLGGLTTDAANNLYILYVNSNQLDEVDVYARTGGFSVSPVLPAGLLFDNNSGTISGTPTVTSPPTAYTVTAVNSQGSSTAGITLQVGPAPAISYTSPQNYVAGTAITPLSPANSGAAVTAAAYSGAFIVFAGSLGSPQQIAADAAGNFYVADAAKNKVFKIPAGGGKGVCIGAGFNKPSGVAVDKAGNVYVADAGNAMVKKIAAADGTIATLGSGFTAPAAIALDTLGNLYVADVATVYKIAPAGAQAQVMAGFNNLSGIAVSPGGRLVYVADGGAGKVYQITTTGSPAYLLSIGGNFNSPSGIARDNSGNLFVSDTRQVYEIPTGQDTQSISLALTPGAGSAPAGLLVDATGNLYFSDSGLGQIDKAPPQGGYYLNMPLPDGLVMDNSTGIISGTPKSVSAAANYTITAYAAGVPGQAVVNISVTANQSAPVLKYSVSPDYAPGSTITPLLPFDTGGPVDPTISYNSTPTVVGTDVTPFGGIAVGNNNTIYVADKLDASVAAIFSDGSVSRLASYLYQPNGICVDNNGAIWIADNQNVREIDNGGYQIAYIIAGGSFQIPTSIAADAHNHIFVGDLGLAGVYRMLNDGSNIVKIDNGITHPDALASDAAGNVYAVSSTANALYKIPADGSPQVTVATFTQPTNVTLDPDGNIFVATNDGHIYMILASGGAPFVVRQSTFANISGLAVDGTGLLYVGQSTSPGVSELTLTGSYKGNSLPAGISINRTTGVITGIAPSNPFPGQFIFNVSGYNLYGGSTYTVFINTSSRPSFSYASPTTFYKGVAATLSPQNGGSVYPSAYYDNNLTIIASGFNNPKGVAVDTAGNVYVADQGNNVVKKILPGGSAPVCVGTGFNSPSGLAIDNAGNIYVADSGNGVVKEIPAAGGQIQIIASGFTSPQALTIDQAGNLYVGDNGNKAIYKIAAGTRTKSLVINTGFTSIGGIALDANGTLYTADSNPNNYQLIYKLPAGSSSLTPVTTLESVISPQSFLVDPYGNLYFLEDFGQQIFEFGMGSQFFTNELSGWAGNAGGMALDGTGSFMIASGNNLYKITPSGGFYLNKTLPNGLVFNQNSGLISGTPQAVSPATNYTITGYYDNVASAAALNLSVTIPSPDATLANLAVNGYTISPAFDATKLSYTATAGWSVTSATVTPTVNNAGATVTINGQPVSSGTSSQSLPLVYGNNTETVKVTAQDAVTTLTYTITINRPLAPETITFNPLASAIYGGPDIAPGATSDNSAAAITYSSDNHAAATIVNENIHIVGAGTANITALQAGDATHMAATSVVQQLVVNQAPLSISADNKTMTAGQPLPPFTFTPGGFVNGDDYTKLSSLPQLSTTATSASAPGQYTISVGGASDPNYTITYQSGLLTIIPSGDAMLSGLALSNGALSPVFSSGTTSYNISVGNGLATMTVTPTADGPAATITVQGQPVSSGQPSQYLTLSVGVNSIPVVVTAQDGSTQTYTLNITEAKSGNANLASLKPASGTFSAPFSPAITTYTENVNNATATMSITPTAANANAAITVNGTPVTSGTPSLSYSLPQGGSTVITTKVTSQLGTTKTYVLTVNRALSSDASLSALTINAGTIVPGFEPYTQLDAYNAKVSSSITAIEVTPTATSANIQSITVNTAAVSSGSPSGPVTLSRATTPINITVTAQDGTQRTYTVTITRVINDASLSNLQVNAGTFTPKFEPQTQLSVYTANEANGTSNVNVRATTTDPNATITINTHTATSGQPTAVATSTGTNPVTITVTAADGSTTRTYNLSIKVAAPPSDNTAYQPVSVEKPTETLVLDDDGILVHQAISPNGDGINDFLQIDNISQYPNNKLSIMNRNGQLIYEANGYDNSSKVFDGHSNKNGQMQLPGTYFYQLDYTVNGITKHKTGFLVLKY